MDATGAGYAVGSTTSSNFVAPGGAQATYGGSNGQLLQAQLGDAWVGKMNAAGTLVLWASYIGGSGDDFATSVSIDAAGNAYVVGATTSANFPTTAGAAQRTYKGFLASDNNGFYNPGDGFAVKVSPSGDQLTYSTYLGGTLNDLPTGAAVASNGNLVVVGGTNSTDFPTTANAPYKQFRGAANFGPSVAGDGFISILNPGGSAFTYSTFFGGRSHDAITGVALDSLDNIFVSGLTFSGDFPVTAGAYQTTFKGLETTTDYSNAAGDAFAAKFNAQGTLAFATYLGGSFRDTATGIALGSDGSLFLTGSTSSANFPTTAAAVQKTYGGDRAYGTTGDSYYGDAFVSKLNAQGSALVYSTYLGGRGDEAGMDIAVDSASNAYVAGFTTSNEFPTSGDALQRTNAGLGGQGFAPNAAQGFPTERVRNTGDAFLTKLSADGTLAYSSFYGGNRDDGAMTVAVDAAGNAYIGGNTLSFNPRVEWGNSARPCRRRHTVSPRRRIPREVWFWRDIAWTCFETHDRLGLHWHGRSRGRTGDSVHGGSHGCAK
ncbi:MAG: SBBP repeat-containing protein [Acidobacteriota bacterium]